jgi:pimeloyl-ACP methyl ester carboxylesterase
MKVSVNEVRIPLVNDTLALRIYTRPGQTALQGPHPVVVLCHGFCGVQGLILPEIAGRFARDGYVAVTFDYRGFGDSSGERGRITPLRQQEDILRVLRWVQATPVLDAQRLALWGVGLGGGHALCIAGMMPWVRCVLCQMPVTDGRQLVMGGMGRREQEALQQMLRDMAERRRISGEELWVPMTRLLRDRAELRFVWRHRKAFPDIAMRIPYLTLEALLDFRPISFAGKVLQPTLIVAAEQDVLSPPDQMQALYQALGGSSRLCILKGASLYDRPEGVKALNAHCDWLRQHLGSVL